MDQTNTPSIFEDDPIPFVGAERRRTPARRVTWRGGRRDSDWINRPPGALERFEQSQRRGLTWQSWRSLRSILPER